MTMDALRKGNQGPQITGPQELLVQRGYAARVDGTFDTRTWQAAKVQGFSYALRRMDKLFGQGHAP